jgi:ribosomal protection tetracycline resistance protein
VIGRPGPAGAPGRQFSPPTLETVVSPRRDGDKAALHLALTQLAELRIEPAPPGAGRRFRLGVELGSMPLAFLVAVEDCVRETLQQGLYGWQVTDYTVTLTHAGFDSPVSVAADFRNLTPLVVMAALKDAGTAVYEPVHSFTLDIPADTFGALLPVLARLRAVPRSSAVRGASYEMEGHIPAHQVHGLERRLPSLTGGEGVLESAFDHYEQVAGQVPVRPRSDHNPLSWKEYLLHVQRRV